MTEKLKERKYGKYGWTAIADSRYDPVEDTTITWPSRKEILDKMHERMSKSNAKSDYASQPTHRKMRERWRALNGQCRVKGIDGMAYEDYRNLWELAGEVEVLEGVMVPAPKLQKKFYQMEFRTLLARVDETSGVGYRPGNVVIVAVEGAWRNHRRIRFPKSLDILSFWRDDGEMVVPEGAEKEELIERLLSTETARI